MKAVECGEGDGGLLAIVVRADVDKRGTVPLTDESMPLQKSLIVKEEGEGSLTYVYALSFAVDHGRDTGTRCSSSWRGKWTSVCIQATGHSSGGWSSVLGTLSSYSRAMTVCFFRGSSWSRLQRGLTLILKKISDSRS